MLAGIWLSDSMRVLGKNVLVQQDPPENKKGSLYVPQGKEDYPNYGTVMGIGGEVTCVAVGDRVVFQRKPGSAISPEARANEEFYGLLVLPDEHILAVISE